jgi:DNA repair protein RecN (Recombination protein N)
VSDWRKEAESIAVQIQELSSSIRDYAQNTDSDPSRLQWLDDRLAVLSRLKRKYGSSIKEILESLTSARQKLQDFETREERVRELNRKIEKTRARVASKGKKLSDDRRRTSEALAKAITAELRDLGFDHAVFSVDLAPAEPSASGVDEIEFGFAPNVGEPMRPLRAIASSGEISRVMLATKAVLAAHDRIPVLVFDEIDTNVGGKTANAVGAKLATVAANHQVLCITHLPQVAVQGTTHFLVTKDIKNQRTFTDIARMDDQARIEEVARMLGGKDLTSVTMDHARELLSRRDGD